MIYIILQELLHYFLIVFIPILSSLLIYYCKKFANVLLERLQLINNQQAQEAARQIIDEAVLDIECVVQQIKQTYVDNLKQANKFDKTTQEIAFQQAFEQIKSLWSIEKEKIIESQYNNLDEFIRVMIENTVQQQKITTNSEEKQNAKTYITR